MMKYFFQENVRAGLHGGHDRRFFGNWFHDAGVKEMNVWWKNLMAEQVSPLESTREAERHDSPLQAGAE